MVRRRNHKTLRCRNAYRASSLCRHRARVRWLLAQRTRLRNYLRSFDQLGHTGGDGKDD